VPRIEAGLQDLLALARLDGPEGLSELLEPLKAELDGIDDDMVKIELNDTNRPDLWTVEGVARGIRCWSNGAEPHLEGLSEPSVELVVHPGLEGIRPWIASFTSSNWAPGESGLAALVNAQEKLCATMGRDRRVAAIGFYKLAGMAFPVHYRPASPDTRFHPLGHPGAMSLADVLDKTDTGVKYAGLLRGFDSFPFLEDAEGRALSFPPVLNSEGTGRVEPEDSELFCEVTGTDRHTVQLLATILACALEDRGATIHPVRVVYPDGSVTVTPVKYADTLTASLEDIRRIIGLAIPGEQVPDLLARMDYSGVEVADGSVTAVMPPYRRDGIHPRDMLEDITIAYGLNRIEPLVPSEFTLGRCSPDSSLASSIKILLVGTGCEEIVRPVLTGSGKITGLTATPDPPVRISNPMTAEYSAVCNTVLPCLLEVESVSAHAAFPHRLFTVGEVLRRTPKGVLETLWSLGVLTAGAGADFGSVHSLLGVLAHNRGINLRLHQKDDPRFIPGRSAAILLGDVEAGMIGEFHPGVLSAWGIQVPASGFEVSIESLRG